MAGPLTTSFPASFLVKKKRLSVIPKHCKVPLSPNVAHLCWPSLVLPVGETLRLDEWDGGGREERKIKHTSYISVVKAIGFTTAQGRDVLRAQMRKLR